jgi:hypothetical protein
VACGAALTAPTGGGVKWMLWSAVLSRGIDNVRSVDDSGLTSGSGWVAVVLLDRGDQCGHFDTSWSVAVAVLAELW